MASNQGDFDIQVFKNDRWITEAIREREIDARAMAKKFLSDKRCAGARVVSNRLQSDGSVDEKVIFEEKQSVKDSQLLKITTVDEVKIFCEKPRDFFSLESRILINRIFRSYLESVTLTPTEVLHNHKEIQRLADRDSLMFSATSHVAKLQSSNGAKGTKKRHREIVEIVDQITAQAERAASLKLPKLSNSFSKTIAAASNVKGDTPEYLAMVVLSRALQKVPSWTDKLEKLCLLVNAETDRKAILLLDTVIADLLGTHLVQELLGWQRSLGSAIISMIDLSEGIYDAEKSDAPKTTERLNFLMKKDILPASRHVLVERALRQLKSSAPLYKADPSKEMEEYQRVMARLLVPGGILSGADGAEAITLRGTQFVKEGGATGKRAVINATVSSLPDPARGVMYLAELTKTTIADEHLEDIVKELDVVFSARVIEELCRRSMSPKDRMVTATGAFMATTTSALPDDIKQQVTEHIDGVLERYLVDENIIDKLDSPKAHLRDRAVRLVKFCGAGVLPEGKALSLARKRVVSLLRQPNFDDRFVDGLSGSVSDKALRDFHKLLVQGGLA